VRRLNYANVTATLALFFAMSGGALAAKHYLINSTKQINPKVIKALKGNRGPAGPQGAAGANGTSGANGANGKEGAQGLRGPSEALTAKGSENFEIGKNESEPEDVVSLKLPAGKWLVSAETGLTNVSGGERSAWCKLESGGTELGRTRALDETAQRSGDATVLGAGAELPKGGTVEFLCWEEGSAVFVPAQSRPAIQAIAVATLNGK